MMLRMTNQRTRKSWKKLMTLILKSKFLIQRKLVSGEAGKRLGIWARECHLLEIYELTQQTVG